ncbi:MAG TPA: hypothetical protein DEA96_14985 [Leptospiraceae bacterium]|nr:hypothetical protein [Spirochaetaceae bacterium]HBS06271.1 hypothetical protein [Leptospiraceae bacterium]|tara:strand:- start:19673 stop:20920 length:1248 start_codon:yes stop_codon:yes gene_type:complete
MKVWRLPLLLVALTGLLLFLGLLASVKQPQVDSFQAVSHRLQGLAPGCAGCHFRVKFALDGPGAAGLSKGIHSIRQELLEHPFFEPRSGDCQGCHAGNHSSWQSSAHGRSFTNPIFQHAFKRDKKAWCLNCHAPLWDPESMDASKIASNPDLKELYAEGINCAACHIRDGTIVGPTDYSGRENDLFHPVTYDPGLAKETFCAGCHQFNFVEELEPFTVYEDDAVMQNTVQEFRNHRESLPRNMQKSCIDCHFESDHALVSQHGKGSSLSHLQIYVSRENRKPGAYTEAQKRYRIHWTIEMRNIGHHYPTGDLFRILTLYAFNASGKEIYRYDFRKEVRVVDRTLIRDTTLKPEPGTYRAKRSQSAFLSEKPIRCELVYRLQGSIEPRIQAHFKPGILRRVIYAGPCESMEDLPRL